MDISQKHQSGTDAAVLPFNNAIVRPIWQGQSLVDLVIEQVALVTTDIDTSGFIGQSLFEITPELTSGSFIDEVAEVRNVPGGFVSRVRIAADGLTYQLVAYWSGDVVRTIGLPINVDDFVELGLGYATERIVKMMPEAPIAYLLATDHRNVRVATESFLRGIGLDEDDLPGLDLVELVHPEDRADVQAALEATQQRHNPAIRVRLRTSDGRYRWQDVWFSAVVSDGQRLGRFTIVQDIDDMQRALELEEQYRRQEQSSREMLSKALNASSDGFAIWSAVRDADGTTTDYILDFMNEVGARPSGQTVSNLLGKPLSVVLSGESDALTALFNDAIRTQSMKRLTIDVAGENGWVGAYENQVVPLSETQVVTSFRDVSAERREQQRLDTLIKRDALTGLLSRTGLEAAWQDGAAIPHELAVAFIDLDNFKNYNDTRGHDYGDQVLRGFAAKLAERCRDTDLVVRLSGDEFVWVTRVDSQDFETVAASMYERISAPFLIGTEPIRLTASVGVVRARSTDPLADVLSRSDRAMYDVKRNGKNSLLIAHSSEFEA
ncbi:MAG TPA: diguanylate cyclase [Microbacteriaceae bacterium]|nr:diguanylate cyclase [Microbacteriaceae bacterium]